MILSRYTHFKADNHTAPAVEVVNDNTIRMQGFRCDTITATGRFLGEDYWNRVSEEDIRELANYWKINLAAAVLWARLRLADDGIRRCMGGFSENIVR